MAEQLLSGIKVLDLTWHIAGPYCTKMLADYGADVLKVERPPGGDPARNIGPFLNDEPHPEKSLLFSHLNLNKRSITLNLKAETGKKLFKEMVKDVDILVESYSPGVMARFGLDYETLKAINPGLVMAAISNFGQDGPYRDFKVSELVISGIAKDQYSNGVEGREPLKYGGNSDQYQAGHMAAVATLAGYWTAATQGIGQYIDCAIQQMLATDVDHKVGNLVSWAIAGRVTMSRRDPRTTATDIAPVGVYPCKDGFIRTQVGVAGWRAFVRLMQNAELEALRFPEDLYNIDLRGIVDAVWYPWCMERTKREIMEQCQASGVHAGAIQTPREVIDDPHYKARGFWVEVEHPVTGKQIYPGAPCDFPDAPWAVSRPAPLLGQHNQEVYCDQLGYSRQEMVQLREAGVI